MRDMLLIFIAILFMAGCNSLEAVGAFSPVSQGYESYVATKTSSSLLSSSYITARTFQELASKSSLIVIGQVEQTSQVLNLARNVDDISKSDPNIVNLGQVYRVKLSSILKEEKPVKSDSLFIVQPEGFLIRAVEQRGRPVTENEIQLARQQTDHRPFVPGHNYLFFLEPLRGFDNQMYFVGVAHPWRFDVTNPENVVPESPWEGATRAFPPLPLREILREIGHVPTPITATIESPLPTPQPEETSFMSPLSTPTLEPAQ
ncbi:MAG: hypothetical protein KJZ95_24490 [Caldilinea sp.]|nr:hypothetical protein [Caldilinea sp.]